MPPVGEGVLTSANRSVSSSMIPADWGVAAWAVQQEYDPNDSHFSSDNTTLNRVWELCRNTLQAGVIGTFTDSNTRDRKPYEADGMIATAGRMLLQREFLRCI
eukprot:SAG11_NODE_13195_length_666_cov_0.724868_1_plen_103_part_00